MKNIKIFNYTTDIEQWKRVDVLLFKQKIVYLHNCIIYYSRNAGNIQQPHRTLTVCTLLMEFTSISYFSNHGSCYTFVSITLYKRLLQESQHIKSEWSRTDFPTGRNIITAHIIYSILMYNDKNSSVQIQLVSLLTVYVMFLLNHLIFIHRKGTLERQKKEWTIWPWRLCCNL